MPKSRKEQVIIIDTNLWISFIISKRLNALDSVLLSNKVRLLFSKELIKEIEATILKPKLKKYFKENALEEMLDVFDNYINFIEVKSKVNVCRDVKDNFLLALAIDGKADYLITGDKDLLSLKSVENTQVITIKKYIEMYS